MLPTHASRTPCLAQWGVAGWHCSPSGQSLKQCRGVFKGTQQQLDAGLSPQGSAVVWAQEANLLLALESQTYQFLSCELSLHTLSLHTAISPFHV